MTETQDERQDRLMREHFDALEFDDSFHDWREHQTAVHAGHKEARDELVARYERRCVEAYREAYPKRKKRATFRDVASTADGRAVIEAERAPFDEAAKKMVDDQTRVTESIKRCVAMAAADHEIVDTAEKLYTIGHVASTYNYNTQTDARGYARGEAERYGDIFRAKTLDVEIVFMPPGEHRVSAEFVVWVSCDELTAQAIKLQGFDLVKAVRACCRRSINPRVYWPFLPHGFEESHGFDSFGRSLK